MSLVKITENSVIVGLNKCEYYFSHITFSHNKMIQPHGITLETQDIFMFHSAILSLLAFALILVASWSQGGSCATNSVFIVPGRKIPEM